MLASYTVRQAQGEPYDADGNRVKSVMNGETVTTIGNLYEKKVVGGATTHTKYYYFNGQRVAMRVAGVLYWLLRDHLGSTTVTANGASGEREAELWYKPWGENRYTFGATPTQRRFTGQVLDEVAGGLYFYNARYYDPALGRFTQADTIVPQPQNPQNLNRYTYAVNNTLRYTDPDGHNPLLAAAVGGFFIGGLVSIGQQAYDNWQQGKAILSIDLGKAAGAAVGGAVFGVTMVIAAPATLIGALGAGAVGGVLGGQAGRATEAVWNEAARTLSGQGWNGQHLLQSCIDNGVLDPTSLTVDAIAGSVSAGVGYGIAKALSGAGLIDNPLLSPTVSGNSGPTITLYRPEKGMILLDTGQRTVRFNQSTFDKLMYYLSIGLFDKASELISEVAGQQTQEALEGATP